MEDSIYSSPSNKPAVSADAQRWCEAFFCIIWAFFFYRALDGESQATCGDPVWFWGNYAYNFYGYGGSLLIIGTIILPTIFDFRNKGGVILYLLVMTVFRVAGLGVTIGMIISFFNRDVCPPLSTIVLVQFIFIAIAVVLTGLQIMCACGLFLFALILASGNQAERRRSISSSWCNLLGEIFPIVNYSRFNRSGYTNI